jgi:hypothetical protein
MSKDNGKEFFQELFKKFVCSLFPSTYDQEPKPQ